MPGPVVLCGGNEFDEASLPVNKALLRLSKQKQPHVVIVPAAAADNPRRATKSGIGYLSALHARAEAAMIASANAADVAVLSAALETADVIYLPDGNPLDAVEGLANSEALARMRYFWEQGTILAASGASAMALCDRYWDSGQWEKGLGLFKGIVVLPHHELVVGRFSGARLRQGLPPEYTILGLDDSTGVIIDGQRADVIGPETVTVYGADSESESEYSEGDTFTLALPLSSGSQG